MTTPDLINGSYELFGGVLIFGNVRRLLKDKTVQGVSLWVQAFFWSWGFWNLYFYSHLDQWFSWCAGMLLTFGSTTWMLLALYYSRNPVQPVPMWGMPEEVNRWLNT